MSAAATMLPPAAPVVLKQCQCSAVYTHAEWERLPNRRFWVMEGRTLEMRDCRCGSSITVRAPVLHRCERNMAGPEEDCGRRIAYTPCGEPAHWSVKQRYASDWWACEEHCREALRDGSDEVCDLNGASIGLDEDGELAVVP